MKIYRTREGILIEKDARFFLIQESSWDQFINDDQLYEKADRLCQQGNEVFNGPSLIAHQLLAPIMSQEIWASGVTYFRSKEGRQEESAQSGGSDFYARVYEAERPELFFKATASRTVGSGGTVRIRKDSNWDVPEPELTLLMSSSGNIIGYTIGNDMSSRSIEGENPLYLPQAKSYDGSASIGPCILVTSEPLGADTIIHMQIERKNGIVFEGSIEISQIKRSLQELGGYLYRECSFPYGSFLMTGTGIVPDKSFTLQSGDEIQITIDPIGTLFNTVA